MARNVEIKARLSSLEDARRLVEPLAEDPPEVLEQVDHFFQVPKGRLKVRTYSDGSGELISYFRSDQTGPKESSYTKIPYENADALTEALGRVLPVRGTVRKKREVFHVGRTRVHLDQVEDLGPFLELEVVMAPEEAPEDGMKVAGNLLEALQISEEMLVAEAYIDLLSESGE